MIIKGFWHILLWNHWYTIVTDQLRILLTSDLYDACEEVNIGCIGSLEERALLERLIVQQYPKLKIKYYSARPEEYEFSTLKLIESDPGDYVGFYFHTKGVTKPGDTIVNHWRAWLNEAILNQWKEHYFNVMVKESEQYNQYDVSSVNHCKPPLHPEHFSGNFYWFNRRYIDRLPKINSLDHKNRWHAEQWICMAKGNFYYPEFTEPGETTFTIKYQK